MKVTLIAKTEMVVLPTSVSGTAFQDYDNNSFSFDADRLAHFAGRSCYQAWDMPRKETAEDNGYLANIIKQGHFSVLEHATATFYIEGVSRNLTHELIRHRHLSYSELSQRFVDMSESEFVVPPAVREHYTEEDVNKPMDGKQPIDDDTKLVYGTVVHTLTTLGSTRKQAREAARFYLPSGVETKIVVSGNHRAWRDMLHKRYSVHADAEIQELAKELLRQLRSIAPATYQDFPTPEEPFQ